METERVRQQMVAQQIRTWDVIDADILNAFRVLRRDEFVPDNCHQVAYADTEIPLPHGQCMLRPSLLGKLLQSLQIKDTDDVLEIGTGSGFLTACLARLAEAVTSVDIFADFAAAAEKKLRDRGVSNVRLECMDVMDELPQGTFDVVTITSAVPKLHQAYAEILNPGGRLFVFVGESPLSTATLVTRGNDNEFATQALFESDVPELLNVRDESTFSF